MERDEILDSAAMVAYAGFLSYGMGFLFVENEHDWGYIPFHAMPTIYRDYDPDFEFVVMETNADGGGTMSRVNCVVNGREPPFVISARCARALGVPRLTLAEMQRQQNIFRWIDDLADRKA